MESKQSQTSCPSCKTITWLDFVKDNTWLKCRICGYMEKVSKRIIGVLKK